jgi:DNA polymerase/3'-5' exonuclease PolX
LITNLLVHYQAAAKQIRETDKEIVSGNDAEELEGIGQHIADHIDEFLDTGKVGRLEELKASIAEP